MESILDICLQIHQKHTGSHEPDMDDIEYREKISILENKIICWTDGCKFDDAVRDLVVTTIAEHYERKAKNGL